MRIAFLIQEVHPNAGQTYNIVEIIKYLLKRHQDWKITVMAKKIYYPLPDGLKNNNVVVKEIDQLYSAIFFRGKIARILKDFDLVYVKGSIPYVFPALKSLKPTILVVHQFDDPKIFNSYNKKIRTILANILTGYVIKKPITIVTVSKELSSFYERKFGIKPIVKEDQISDIYYTNVPRNKPDDDTIKLLTMGWDCNRKNTCLLLEYLSKIKNELKKFQLTIAGTNNEIIPEIKKIATNLELEKNIVLKGYLSENELKNEFLSNHIYVTSTTYEGFYRPLVEAFATGMPGLVYDSRRIVGDISKSASANHIINSGAGRLYEDPKSFLEGITDIFNNYEIYSKRALSYAENFHTDKIGYKTEQLIIKLVNST